MHDACACVAKPCTHTARPLPRTMPLQRRPSPTAEAAHLRDLGFQVVHEDEDFFENDSGDYVVSNPPFSILADVLRRLVHLQKPFVLIMPCSVLTTQYFQKLSLDVQLIVPKRRIQFTKIEDGRVVPTPRV